MNADKAAIASAQAQLAVQQSITENAKVQLSYTDIRSPIDGRTGNNTIKVGNLATVNQELVTIAQLQPVYVTFTVPAVHLPTIKQHLGADKLSVVATPQDEDKKAGRGQLTFVDNLVDSATDTIKLKATFPNDDRRLWPGQFARVSLRLATLVGRDGRAEPGGPDRSERPVCLRRQAGRHRGAAAHHGRPAHGRRRRHRQGPDARGNDRHRRSAAAGTGHARAIERSERQRSGRRQRRRSRWDAVRVRAGEGRVRGFVVVRLQPHRNAA